jgi:ketosteroid isomerase-like protein
VVVVESGDFVTIVRLTHHANDDASRMIQGDRGGWRGHFTEDGVRMHAAGTYATEWRREADGEWRVSAERFELG